MKERLLANGLRIFALDIPWMRVFHVGLWFRAGLHDAGSAHPQVPHLLEHLCMRGPDGDPDRFALWLESNGAMFNATVHHEWTVFTGRLRSHAVDEGLRALRQIAFGTVSWTEEHAAIERKVLQSEVGGMARDFGRRLSHDAKGLLMPESPYAISYGTQIKSLDETTLAHVLAFRRQYLTPANSILLLCGPGADELLSRAATEFAEVPPGKSMKWPDVTAVKAGQRRHLRDNNSVCGVAVAFPAPAYTSPDQKAMLITHGLLCRGTGSLLYRKAVLAEGLTYRVGTEIEYAHTYGVGVFYARLRDDASRQRFLAILEEGFTAIASGKVTAEELHRARERYLTYLYVSLESPEELMKRHGEHLLHTGEPYDPNLMIRQIAAVTLSDIQETWARYVQWPRTAVITIGGETE